MKFRTLATLACVGFLAATSAYAEDAQPTDNQMLADNSSAAASPLAAAGNPADAANASEGLPENVAGPDVANQSALNNVPNPAEDIAGGSQGGNDMSPDTATGDDY
jgi:hypothetical protein